MKLILEISKKTNDKTEIQIIKKEGSTFLLGRSDADIEISDLLCSRQHARIFENSNHQICLEDLSSKNGIYVGSQRVGILSLKAGVIFRIGAVNIKVIECFSDSILESLQFKNIEKGGGKLFAAMSEENRRKFSGLISKESQSKISRLNEILKKMKQNEKS
jgi:pSer/pThr/pTyr-binding forkhead associated (FHA) protein